MTLFRRNPLDVSDLLKKEPWLTKNEISTRLDWPTRAVDDILKLLEVERKMDKTNGRAFRYAIKLPRGKLMALALMRRREQIKQSQD